MLTEKQGNTSGLLKNLTYDPDAVYDDEWLSDTLYDSAVGAALGGLAGAADAVTERTKVDTDTLGKQENPVQTESVPLHVGRVTTIRNPYTGKTPVQTQKSKIKPVVSKELIEKAEANIQEAQDASTITGNKGFKTLLMHEP